MREMNFTYIEEADIYQCNDCGAYAGDTKDIKHFDSCTPGTSKHWETFYNENPELGDK